MCCVSCRGIRIIVDGRHVFPGHLHIFVTAVTDQRLDDRGFFLCSLADDMTTKVVSTMIMSVVYLPPADVLTSL